VPNTKKKICSRGHSFSGSEPCPKCWPGYYQKIDLKKIEAIAKKHYSNLPYHNFQHALWVRQQAKKFIQRCKKYNVPVKSDIIEIAALFHDAGYSEVKNNKEAHSCKIAEKELKLLGLANKTIRQVTGTIMATKAGYPLRTAEQKIIRAADLSSFTSNYKTFVANSKKIQQEYTLLSKKSNFPFRAWTKLTESYLKPNIILTPEHKKDDFHHKARKNIKKFLQEFDPKH